MIVVYNNLIFRRAHLDKDLDDVKIEDMYVFQQNRGNVLNNGSYTCYCKKSFLGALYWKGLSRIAE